MNALEKAQILFNSYEKDGRLHKLRDSLEILDEIIEGAGTEAERAIKIKNLIRKHIDTQMDKIYLKSNVNEFEKNLNDDDIALLLFESLSKEDLSKYFGLFLIEKDYFKLNEYP